MKNFLSFIFTFLLFVNYSFAEAAIQDPDLNLSIEELRRKYPIGWLEEKYGNYNKFCRSEDCDYNCPKKPKNLVCIFYYDSSNARYLEDAKKVSFDDFSESEIKSIFVHYNSDYASKTSMMKEDGRISDIIDVFIDYFANKKVGTLTQNDKKILKFVFSQRVFDLYGIRCVSAKKYLPLKMDYCVLDKKEGQQLIKQKFQQLFFSKF